MSPNGQHPPPNPPPWPPQALRALDPDHVGDAADAARPVLGLRGDHGPHETGWHRHRRCQLLYAIRGTMTAHTRDGTWVVPPQQAVWLPAGIEHNVVAARGMAMRSLYLEPGVCHGMPATCCVLPVPPLLRELVLRAVELGADYPPDGAAARLVAVIPDELRRLSPEPLHLPLPEDPRLAAVTGALVADPGDRRDLADWAARAGASERTLARLFQKETGMTFRAWRQRRRLQAAIERLRDRRINSEGMLNV